MSKKTKLNRRQLEALVRSKLQEKLNIQEDVGDWVGRTADAAASAAGKVTSAASEAGQAVGTEVGKTVQGVLPGDLGPATDIASAVPHGAASRVGKAIGSLKRETGKWSDAIPRNQSMQEAQLNEFFGDVAQGMMDYAYGTGRHGGGTIHGEPWRDVAARMARTGGVAYKRDDAQNVKGPQPSAVDNLGPRAGAQFMREAVADVVDPPDMPETADLADLDDVEAFAADEVMDDITEQAAGDAVKAAAANAEEDGDELGSMGDAVKNEHLSDKEWYDNQLFENLKKKWIR